MRASDLFTASTLAIEEAARMNQTPPSARMLMVQSVVARAMVELPTGFVEAVAAGATLDHIEAYDVEMIVRGYEVVMVACGLTIREIASAAKENGIAMPDGAGDWPEVDLLVSRYRDKYGMPDTP